MQKKSFYKYLEMEFCAIFFTKLRKWHQTVTNQSDRFKTFRVLLDAFLFKNSDIFCGNICELQKRSFADRKNAFKALRIH